MTWLPELLLHLRALDPAASRHVLRMTPKQSHELADFLNDKLPLPWCRKATHWAGDLTSEEDA